jgi:hypothetical protein
MKAALLAATVAAALGFAPLSSAESPQKSSTPKVDSDMQRAIAWERFKDMAAARQARKEKVHPSVTYSNPDRNADRTAEEGRQVKDPGEPQYRQGTKKQ